MTPSDSEEQNRQALAKDYLSSFAFCNLASFDLFPQDRYASLRDTLEGNRAELEAEIRRVYVPPTGKLFGRELPREFVGSSKSLIDKKFVHSDLIADEIETAVEGTKDWQVKTIKTQYEQALVFTHGDEAQVYFCPTPPMSLAVWLKDFDVAKAADFTTGTGVTCKVHEGFKEVLETPGDNLLDKVRAELTDENGKLKFKYIDVGGYSLGAGLTGLFVSSLNAEERSHVRKVTTFGDPQAGNQAFVDDLNNTMRDRITNIVDNGDIFTHILKIRFPDFGRPGQDVPVGPPFPHHWDIAAGLERHLPLAYITAMNAWAKGIELPASGPSQIPSTVLDGIAPIPNPGRARS